MFWVTKDDEFESRENLLLRGFLWKLWTIQIPIQQAEATVFHFNTPLQFSDFRLNS